MAKKPRAGGRKPRGRKAESTEGVSVLDAAQASGRFKAPTAEQVQKLVKKLTNLRKDQQAASGAIGEAVAKACENQHFDRKALGMARQLEKMSDDKLAVTLPHLLKYIDDLQLGERATQQAEMFKPEPDELEGQSDIEDVARPGLRVVPISEDAAAG